jgi:hypothetical protein
MVVLAGCGQANTSGLTPDATSTMTVTSTAFTGGTLAQHFTCHGAGVSPPLDWSGGPASTKSYAIVVDDSAAPITPYIYWIVFNIPQATTDLQAASCRPGPRWPTTAWARPATIRPARRGPGTATDSPCTR